MNYLRNLLPLFTDHSLPRHYPHISEALTQYTKPDGITIEIGCGGKQYSPYIHGHHIGLDLQTDLYPGQGPDIIADAQALPFATASADIILAIAVLHNIQNWQQVIVESAQVLRPEGQLLIFDYKPRVAKRLNSTGRFTPHTLQHTAKKAGLIAEFHTKFLPLRRIGLLANPTLRHLIAPFAYFLSNWIVMSAHKAAK